MVATGGLVVAVGMILGVVLVMVAAAALPVPGIVSAAAPGSPHTTPDGVSPTAAAPPGTVGDIPAPYLAAFDSAAARFAVPWSVLAGIYRVECDFGTSRLPGCPPGTRNSVGAQGPGQFLPGTWRHSLGPGAVIRPGPPAPDGSGYATDGDGDGVADAWDPYDATASTARLLAADGATRDVGSAIFGYNHDPAYVTQVLSLAAGYARTRAAAPPPAAPSAGVSGPGGGGAVGPIGAALAFARIQLGLPYRWGGSGPQSWDCSGLVQAAMARAGLSVTHDAAAQYAATAAAPAPLAALLPGDLVFYGRSAATIHHVGIAVDATHMIDAPYTGTVVRVDLLAASDLFAATRPLG